MWREFTLIKRTIVVYKAKTLQVNHSRLPILAIEYVTNLRIAVNALACAHCVLLNFALHLKSPHPQSFSYFMPCIEYCVLAGCVHPLE